MKNLFEGAQVRLSIDDPEPMSQALSRWSRDVEYFRLLDNDPMRFWSSNKWKEWFEQSLDKPQSGGIFFTIYTLDGNRPIGFIAMFGESWNAGDTNVGIAIGEREYWGKGLGSDAMQVFLRYAFQELNLHRVTLFVFEYNERARRSYEKAGFRVEGRLRKALLRDGQRWDVIAMGVLRQDWEQRQAEKAFEDSKNSIRDQK